MGEKLTSDDRLRQAVLHEDLEATRTALDAGADPDKGDIEGKTALHLAALANQGTAVAKALIDGGAFIPAVTTRSLDTPLHVLCRRPDANPRLLKLLNRDSAADAVNRQGRTPADEARMAGNKAGAQFVDTSKGSGRRGI